MTQPHKAIQLPEVKVSLLGEQWTDKELEILGKAAGPGNNFNSILDLYEEVYNA
jgi:hypothetical protein